MEKHFPYRKVLIVGCGGAGKSTLAAEMGKRFGLPIVHLDKLWWLPGWKNRSEQSFDELLSCELIKDDWIIEGNFFRTFKTRLKHATFAYFSITIPSFAYKACMSVLKSIRARPDPI